VKGETILQVHGIGPFVISSTAPRACKTGGYQADDTDKKEINDRWRQRNRHISGPGNKGGTLLPQRRVGERDGQSVYNMEIMAVRDREAGEQLVFDINALKPLPGFEEAKKLRLEPGHTHVFTFPLEQLICVIDRRDVPLVTLLKQGYSVCASFEVSGIKLVTPNLAPPK
jgi:hypothetical protein